MNTAARRQRMLDLLHRGTTTVPQMAEVLGISDRTAYRDIGALREDGYSIRATSGPGGGVSLDLDSRPRPVHFEVGEILGLALSVAILRATPGMPFAASAERALDRARRALSRERQRSMQRLQRRILVGDVASNAIREGLGDVDPELLGVFEEAFANQRSLCFDYVDRFGAPSEREAECVAIFLRHPAG
jgi:predicted DNA-binding transcriptional regulator YafY